MLTWALNIVDPPAGASLDFRPDGAYWVDAVVARDVPIADEATGRPADDAKAVVRATSEAIPAPTRLPVVDTGVTSPPGHSTPYVRSGLRYVDAPVGTPLDTPVANRLVVDLANGRRPPSTSPVPTSRSRPAPRPRSPSRPTARPSSGSRAPTPTRPCGKGPPRPVRQSRSAPTAATSCW